MGRTGRAGCAGTPYEQFAESAIGMMNGADVYDAKLKRSAVEMRDFLLGLIPNEKEQQLTEEQLRSVAVMLGDKCDIECMDLDRWGRIGVLEYLIPMLQDRRRDLIHPDDTGQRLH